MSLSTFAAATIGLASLTTTDADTPKAEMLMAQAVPFVSTQSYVGPKGDYMTTPQGCTYRKTKAPGYPARWILVLNPHHIGKPNSPRNCKGML
ncbi:hypothetical protein [Tropicibacter naphthalenivorans]|uniref:Uncharacterized protein n=1 Tax=Tropicibacter naphthalenivorans TaxID=441103 RepID=A0A0P1G7L6_9RHOB|nr:hypothetical protein [Tropicibacter naphthalenivorans]CUH77500.1 hypothetical protein TRN7648_01507 [Tropicibacter naphthalenivorans]SMC56787.1 hypothetical protein SAMN04488093_102111 [Tropicibacter naphthalenivorans]